MNLQYFTLTIWITLIIIHTVQLLFREYIDKGISIKAWLVVVGFTIHQYVSTLDFYMYTPSATGLLSVFFTKACQIVNMWFHCIGN